VTEGFGRHRLEHDRRWRIGYMGRIIRHVPPYFCEVKA
jgi:hypothetical protein